MKTPKSQKFQTELSNIKSLRRAVIRTVLRNFSKHRIWKQDSPNFGPVFPLMLQLAYTLNKINHCNVTFQGLNKFKNKNLVVAISLHMLFSTNCNVVQKVYRNFRHKYYVKMELLVGKNRIHYVLNREYLNICLI